MDDNNSDVTGQIAIGKDVSLSGKISDLFDLKKNIISIIFLKKLAKVQF